MEGVGLLTPSVAILVIFAFAVMSFLFALAESSLFSLGQQSIHRMRQQKAPDADWIVQQLGNPHEVMAVLVFGNTLFNSAIWATGLLMVISGIWPPFSTLSSLVILILIGCEVMPKALAVRLPEKWSMASVRLLTFLQWLNHPLRHVTRWMNQLILRWTPNRFRKEVSRTGDSDYQELLELGYQQGMLGLGEKEIILEIIELDCKCATDVMTPRSQVVALPFDLALTQMCEEARKQTFRRIPLYSETLDQMVGILDTRKLFLNPEGDLFECTELPSFVPESMNLLALFKSLQRQRRGMAVVVDEFGGLAGVVTMEDILEEILGPIRNENESEAFEIEVLAPGKWRVSGLLEVDAFREYCPSLEEVVEVDTMGGLFTMKLGYVPEAEETVLFGNLKLTSKIVGERRIKELLVQQMAQSGNAPSENKAAQ